MKNRIRNNNIITLGGWLLALLLGGTACGDDIHDFTRTTGSTPSKHIYIADADTAFTYPVYWTADTVNLAENRTIAKFPVYLSEPAPSDVKVTVQIDNTLVDFYNTMHGTEYRPALERDLEVKTTVTIPAGATRSQDSISVVMSRTAKSITDTLGYLIPVRISSYSGADAAPDYEKRHAFLRVEVAWENGISFQQPQTIETSVVGQIATGVGAWIPNSVFFDPNTVNFTLNAVFATEGAVSATVSVNNDLIEAYNAANGSDYQPIPETDLTQSYNVDFALGDRTKSTPLAYSGDNTGLNDPRGYLVPLEITSLAGEGVGIVTVKKVHYVVVQVSNAFVEIVSADAAVPGARVNDRSRYTAPRAVDNTGAAFNYWIMAAMGWGDVTKMFTNGASDSWIAQTFTGKRAFVTVDFGTEVQNITGLRVEATMYTKLKEVEVWVVAEDGTRSYVGKMARPTVPAGATILKFSEPVTAKRIELNNMISDQASYMGLGKFYLFTQPE